jgi:Holliday junction resolvasome RuvABC endonuclease subunit
VSAPVAVGLDLSLTGSGVASSLGWCERVGASDITTMDLDDRLAAVGNLVGKILDLTGGGGRWPEVVCVEVPAFSRSGGGVLERSALWWNVVAALRRREVPVVEIYIGQRMRYATGKGSASKGAVIDAVARRWPQFETGGDDNLADAAVLAAMGADWLGAPIGAVPATHRKALDGVEWPEKPLRLEPADALSGDVAP